MTDISKKQAEFYDKFHGESHLNFPSKLWRRFRWHIKSRVDIVSRVAALQKSIILRERPGHVLEIGCFEGSDMSFWIIDDADVKKYVGIELSGRALEAFRNKLDGSVDCEVELQHGDFMAMDYPSESFDVIYMGSVLHHFPDLPGVCERLEAILRPGGCIVTLDPLLTNPVFRFARAVYRPFQKDAEWEWPLTRRGLSTIQNYFVIDEVRGFLGYEMFAAIIYAMIPCSTTERLLKRARHADERQATRLGRGLWRCNLIHMCLRKPAVSSARD